MIGARKLVHELLGHSAGAGSSLPLELDFAPGALLAR